MDRSQRCTELATTVTGSQLVMLQCVWGYMKAIVYARKVNMGEEPFLRIKPQCFVRLDVLWSHRIENVSKQADVTLEDLHEYCCAYL